MAFGHLEIHYDSDVLEPRAWTQHQSRWAAELLSVLPAGDVLELCAGVGHIGLLAIAGSDRHLVQVDVEERACELARANASHARTAGDRWSVEIRHRELESSVNPGEQFALVTADPPWVRSDHTRAHPADPEGAIDGGDDGLDVARSCLAVIGAHLAPEGAALLQVGDREQVRAVERYVAERPGLALRVAEHRTFDGGALVRLARLPGDAEG